MTRVLVVDDATTVRMFHRRAVEELGFQVEEATNGVEALEKCMEQSFDLLLVDVNMPKMDGFRFLREVRRRRELQHLPAIMITTEDQPADMERAYEAGANLLLAKPTRPVELQKYVKLLTEAN